MSIRTRLTLGFLACGLAPLLISGAIGYLSSQKGLGQLREHAAEDIRNRAVALLEQQRGLKTQQVEKYFRRIADQAVTFAENRMVVEAMRHLPGFFTDYTEETLADGADVETLREELREYYAGDFASTYAEQNDGAKPNVDAWLDQLDADSVALQHAYIRANENPLGSKHLLDTADNATDYGRLHAVVHPVPLTRYLRSFRNSTRQCWSRPLAF
ncbi:MAG: hypothetical protein AAF266_11635, partial [Planctomycetota bacterium]